MKKALAILLVLVLVFSAALPAFAGDRNAWLDGETSLAKIGKLTVSSGGKAIAAECGSYSGDFVRHNGNTYACAADKYSSITLAQNLPIFS